MSIYKSNQTYSVAFLLLYDNSVFYNFVPSTFSFSITQKEEALETRLIILRKMLSCRKREKKPWGGEAFQRAFIIVILENKFE